MEHIYKMSNAGGFKSLTRYADMLAGNPASLPVTANLYRRFDASVASSIISSGGLVSQWNDISGNGGNAVQATSSAQPTTGAATQNGLNVITSTSKIMQSPVSITSNALTYFITYSRPNAGDATNNYARHMSIWKIGGNDYDTTDSILGYTSGTVGSYSPGVAVYRNNGIIASAPFSFGTANLDVFRVNGTAVTMWHNGTSYTGTTQSTSLNANSMALFGAAAGVADSYMNGWIGEIILYNAALSDSDVATMSAWMKAKWGTA